MTNARTAPPQTISDVRRGLSTKRVSVLTAATEVFCREGFSGACIDEIAEQAGVSRQTIYNHYRDKEALFVAIVEDITARTGEALSSTIATFPDVPADIAAEMTALVSLLVRNCLCNRDGRFMRKLLQSEGERYPQLFAAWRQKGSGLPAEVVSGLFARIAKAGLLDIDDADLAARQFLALIHADLQTTTLFGGIPGDEDVARAARNAVRTFLRAYSVPA